MKNLRWRLATWLAGGEILRAPEHTVDQRVWILMLNAESHAWLAVDRIRIQERNAFWRNEYGHRPDGRGYRYMDAPRGRSGRFVGTLFSGSASRGSGPAIHPTSFLGRNGA